MLTLTVSQLNRYLKAVIEENDALQDLYIKAEISNFKLHTPSGHMYFSLKEEASSVRGIMFSSYAEYLKFLPEDGMSVIVRGHIGVYERDGTYQLYATDMQPDGEGAMAVAVRQVRDRLEKQGFFDEKHKKSLPNFPKIIGVITAETGAAIGDITQVLSRRYPLGTLLFAPALVQGKEAVPSLIQALETLDGRCDVIIIGRGGGSTEDLWAFQDEMLVRAIFMAQTPIISAIGHEMDTTICDLVADRRAPTPSAAAELATPSLEQLLDELEYRKEYLASHAENTLFNAEKILGHLAESPALEHPTNGLKRKQEQLDFITKTMYNVVYREFENQKKKVSRAAALLDSLSPLAVLARGYAAAFKDRKPIRSLSQLTVGDHVVLKLADGQAGTIIETLEQKGLTHE